MPFSGFLGAGGKETGSVLAAWPLLGWPPPPQALGVPFLSHPKPVTQGNLGQPRSGTKIVLGQGPPQDHGPWVLEQEPTATAFTPKSGMPADLSPTRPSSVLPFAQKLPPTESKPSLTPTEPLLCAITEHPTHATCLLLTPLPGVGARYHPV